MLLPILVGGVVRRSREGRCNSKQHWLRWKEYQTWVPGDLDHKLCIFLTGLIFPIYIIETINLLYNPENNQTVLPEAVLNIT